MYSWIAHRYESNRILHEFLLGPVTMSRIQQGIKSAEARKNDRSWFYQHLARCPKAIQIFLDANPDYWCLVPMLEQEVQMDPDQHASIPSRRRLLLRSMQPRIEAEAKYYMEGVSDPPESFVFTEQQRSEQLHFFSQEKERLQSPEIRNHVHLFRATIVAVCS